MCLCLNNKLKKTANPMVENYERRRSPNKTNLGKTHNALMSAAFFHSQNVGVRCLVEFICITQFVYCSTTLPIIERAVSAKELVPISNMTVDFTLFQYEEDSALYNSIFCLMCSVPCTDRPCRPKSSLRRFTPTTLWRIIGYSCTRC